MAWNWESQGTDGSYQVCIEAKEPRKGCRWFTLAEAWNWDLDIR